MRGIKIFGLALSISLTGCGGGGSGTGSGPIGGTTPTPQPTTSPTPTPTFTYSQIDLSQQISIQATSSEMRFMTRYGQDTAPFYLFESGSAKIEGWDRTTLSWDPQKGEFAINAEIFTPAERYPNSPGHGTEYLKYLREVSAHPSYAIYSGTTSVIFEPYWKYKYLNIATRTEDAQYREDNSYAIGRMHSYQKFLVGGATAPGDLPTSGSVRIATECRAGIVVADRYFDFGWYDDLIDVDFVSHTLRGSVQAKQLSYITGTDPMKVQLELDATYNPSTGRIDGTLRSADGSFSGRVLGYFYGPRAAELGLVVQMTWQNGVQPIAGTIVGQR